jgi:hypothetical protein
MEVLKIILTFVVDAFHNTEITSEGTIKKIIDNIMSTIYKK